MFIPMDFLLHPVIVFSLLLNLVAGCMVNAYLRLIRWRWLVSFAFPPLVALALLGDALFSNSGEAIGGAIVLLLIYTPIFYLAYGVGLLLICCLRSSKVSKAKSTHET